MSSQVLHGFWFAADTRNAIAERSNDTTQTISAHTPGNTKSPLFVG